MAIVDTAHFAATMAMESKDHAKAKRTVEIAINAAPEEEVPRLDLAKAANALGELAESIAVT